MFKTGETKVPFEKIPALAAALGVDVGHLVRLGLEQYWPERFDVIGKVFSRIVTANEMEFVGVLRQASVNADPKMTASQRLEVAAAIRRRR